MTRRSQLLRVAKWGGIVLGVIGLLLWLASARWMIEYRWSRGTSMYGVFIVRGAAGISVDVKPDLFYSGEMAIQDEMQRPRLLREIAAKPWNFERLDPGIPQIRWPAVWASRLSGTDTFIPFWIPLIVIVIPTAIFWWRDRPPRAGHCPCGYNLTGNVSGTCPECGEAATGESDQASGDAVG